MEKILCSLYDTVCQVAKLKNSGKSKGFEFEDIICKVISGFSKELNIKVSSPRQILDLPTFSGNKHQVDCFFTRNKMTYIVECKRRQFTTKDQIYYFNSILMDYVLGLQVQKVDHFIKGIFISTAPIDDACLKYCIVYAISVVHPHFPPIEYMLLKTTNEKLRDALEILYKKLPKLNPLFRTEEVSELHWRSLNLLEEYKYLIERWKLTG